MNLDAGPVSGVELALMGDDDSEEQAGDSDSQRIEALENRVAALELAFQNLSALHIVSEARFHALKHLLSESLELLESQPRDQFLATLRAMEREACETQLAHISDNRPHVATILKEMIDRMLPPDSR